MFQAGYGIYSSCFVDFIGAAVTFSAFFHRTALYRIQQEICGKSTFEDNTGNNAFSLPPSTIYTERWEIWIMSSANSNLVDNTLIWDSFGSNAEDRAEANGTAETNLDKYYHCEVNRQKLPCRERSLFASCRGALYIFRDTAGNFYPAEASFQTCAGLKFSVQH